MEYIPRAVASMARIRSHISFSIGSVSSQLYVKARYHHTRMRIASANSGVLFIIVSLMISSTVSAAQDGACTSSKLRPKLSPVSLP